MSRSSPATPPWTSTSSTSTCAGATACGSITMPTSPRYATGEQDAERERVSLDLFQSLGIISMASRGLARLLVSHTRHTFLCMYAHTRTPFSMHAPSGAPPQDHPGGRQRLRGQERVERHIRPHRGRAEVHLHCRVVGLHRGTIRGTPLESNFFHHSSPLCRSLSPLVSAQCAESVRMVAVYACVCAGVQHWPPRQRHSLYSAGEAEAQYGLPDSGRVAQEEGRRRCQGIQHASCRAHTSSARKKCTHDLFALELFLMWHAFLSLGGTCWGFWPACL